jgi:hypothetical protein
MRRVVLLAVLALALPTAALANIIDYTNGGSVALGTATITGTASSGQTLTLSSELTGIGATLGNLGTVTVKTGVLVGSNGSFTFTGGSISIVENGITTPLFTGTFTSGTVMVVNGFVNVNYFVGGLAGGFQITKGGVVSGDTIVTPEPGTLGLLGTGLVGLAGIVRRKIRG